MLQKFMNKTSTLAKINGAKVDALKGEGKAMFFQRRRL